MRLNRTNNTVIISGVLDHQHITDKAYRDFLQQISEADELIFDDVERCDSSCVALLVDAKIVLRNKMPKIKKIPDTVYSLMQLYGVADWMNLQ